MDGVANNTTLSVMQILQATNALASGGVLYSGNTSLCNLANNVYSAINQLGGIA